MPMTTPTRLALCLPAAALVACSGSTDEPAPSDAPTYHGAVRASLEQRCNSCHAQGGVGPFPLTTYEEVKRVAPAVLAAVESGRMPPWLPDPDCRRYTDERLMPAAEIEALRQWVAADLPEGDPADYVAPASAAQALTLEQLGPPDMEAGPEVAYAPNPERPDDYRCFPLEVTFTEESFMKAALVVPDKEALVHHVILYRVAPEFSAQVDALDAADEGPGYSCFGGVGAGQPTPVGGWTPGDAPIGGSDDAGIRMRPGTRLVMQMHYNTLSTAPSPDNTQVRMWFHDERPEIMLEPRFLPHLGIEIEAGDERSSHSRVFRNTSDRPWTVVSTTPHMHLLGASLKTVKVAADGSETCLVDIPEWDFDWQQGYTLREPLVVEPGEALRLDCAYDNSAANQPVINGERGDPVRVTWGEGTLDEMCLNVVTFAEPYTPPVAPGDICEGFQDCYDTCVETDFPLTGCVLQCGADNGCAACALPGLIASVTDTCGVQAEALIQCFELCDLEDDTAACISTQCSATIFGFDLCARSHVEAGVADAAVSGCGVEL